MKHRKDLLQWFVEKVKQTCIPQDQVCMSRLEISALILFRRATSLSVAMATLLSLSTFAQVPQLLNHQGRVAVSGINFEGTGQFKFALVDGGIDVSRLATATPVITGGVVVSVTVIDGGAGYTTAPTAIVRDIKFGTGTGALLQSVVSNGVVIAINVLDGGSRYNTLATVQIPAPPANIIYQTYWINATDTNPADGEPDAYVSLPVTKGLYSVLLGDTTRANMAAISPTVFSNPDVRLRVWFNDGTLGFQQLSPDARIASSGYALIAGTVTDGAIGEDQLATGAVTEKKIAEGAVGASQIAAGSVGTAQLATGAVTAANIAPGAITSDQIAKPPRSGSIPSSALDIQFHTANFSVDFSPAFSTVPVVTFAMQGEFGCNAPVSPSVVQCSNSLLIGRIASPLQPQTVIVNYAHNEGDYTSLAMINGKPAIVCRDTTSNDLKYTRALDEYGATWSPPTIIGSTGGAGEKTSLAMVNEHPAVAYMDTSSGDLKYSWANDGNGTSWNTLTLDSADYVGQFASLAVIDGYPAIAYYDATNSDLKYIRATDADGASWSAPCIVDSIDQAGQYASLAVVNGRPAISYYDFTNQHLKYIRAADTTGTTWGTPVTIDSDPLSGIYTSMAVIDGCPAIAYSSSSNRNLTFIRAIDADGTLWNEPLTLDSASQTGMYTSLTTVAGKPAVAYYDAIYDDLKYVRATTEDGSTWGNPVVLDSGGNVGINLSLAVVSGNPAVAYYDSTNGDLKYIRSAIPEVFTVQWIALEP